ncbi:MAG: tetratricopeptide repeat protein [Elusimicrobia bacterium]|nr:tetratricopeptide repeat protein [Elusimicrobiota bacterium]
MTSASIFRAALLAAVCASGAAAAEPGGFGSSEEALSLSLTKMSMGTLTGVAEKKQYLATIQLEKQKIQQRMLQGVYENAMEFYRQGDYDRAQELANTILAIDPTFSQAHLIIEASSRLKGAPRRFLSERMMLEEKFRDGLRLYKEGRIVEAAVKWEEVLQLSPTHLKARYWYKKAHDEIAQAYTQRGYDEYSKGNYQEALNNWYNALLTDRDNKDTLDMVAKVESMLRDKQTMGIFQQGLEQYAQGRLEDSYHTIEKVLDVDPGNAKAAKMVRDIKDELAGQFIDAGKKLYSQRKYTSAIETWNKAKKYDYNPKYLAQLETKAREQMRKEAEEAKRQEEQARREAEEAAERERKQREEEDKRRMQNEIAEGAADAAGKEAGQGQKITMEQRAHADQLYREGMVAFQNGDIEKARSSWNRAKQIDPGNADVDAGLRRIEQMVGQ